jgi:uncharacterized RmlC-like cupin family protein
MSRRFIRSAPPLNYEKFLSENVKYNGNSKCFVHDCKESALYEGGDARFHCGMCEEHAAMRGKYRLYLNEFYPIINTNITNEQAYLLIVNRYNNLYNKIEKALEVTNGPELSKT